MATNIEIVLAPSLYQFHSQGGNVVLIDVARFTSTMITALANGAVSAEVYPDTEIPLCLKREHGYLLVGETKGLDIEGFDFNNSPVAMTPENVSGRKLAFSTSNGTYTRSVIDNYDAIYAGGFINAKALVDRLIAENRNVKLVCSGRSRNIAIEDMIFAGYVAERLSADGGFTYNDDSVPASMLMWQMARENPLDFVLRMSPSVKYSYGKRPHYRADIDTVFLMDTYDVVPEEIAPLKFVVKR